MSSDPAGPSSNLGNQVEVEWKINPLFLLGVMAELIGVQFLSLGLMGEILARVYFESQGKRAYLVRDKINLGETTVRQAA